MKRRIKNATADSLDIIQQLAFTIWPKAYGDILSKQQIDYMLGLIYSKEALTRQYLKLRHRFILLFENNEAAGFASFSEKNIKDPGIYRLHKLYVLNQRKGSGKFLLDHIIDQVKTEGGKFLELNVNRHNPAVQFYKRMGFEITGDEDIDIGQGFLMNDYIMTKALG